MNRRVDESVLPTAPNGSAGKPSRALLLAVLGVVLVAAGAGLWVASGGHARPGGLVGPNLPVSAEAANPMDISANSSPSLARNPVDAANLVVANRVDLPAYSCALHATFDGGSTWAPTPVPFPEGEELPARCYGPDVAYGVGGTLYVSYVTLKGRGNSPNAVWVASSTDGGRTLSAPIRAAGPLAFQVRLIADPERPGRLHLTWLQAEEVGVLSFTGADNPIVAARSDDGGSSWSTPVRVSPRSRARALAPAAGIGRDGQRYVLYLDLGDDRLDYGGAHQGRGGEPYPGTWSLVLARSTDGGQTWQETTVDGAVQPIQRINVFLPPTPVLAVDPGSGTLYATYADALEGDADVWLWTSADSGESFKPRRRVNDTQRSDGTDQYLPALTVAPDGRLDVIYYDRRRDPGNVRNEVSFQSSRDQGRSFSPRQAVTDGSFDSRIGPGGERGLADLGSRLALFSAGDRVLAVWTDTRAGSDVTAKQDLARAIVQVSVPARPSGPMRALSAALMAAGAAALVMAARHRRHPAPTPTGDETVLQASPALTLPPADALAGGPPSTQR